MRQVGYLQRFCRLFATSAAINCVGPQQLRSSQTYPAMVTRQYATFGEEINITFQITIKVCL